MKRIHQILVFLAILLVLLYLSRHGYDSSEGFEGGKEVMIFKAEWCGHCKTAKPAFDELLAASPISLKNGTKVTVRVLDADADKEEVSKHKVQGYPSIFIMNGDKKTEYPGPRTKEGVIDFLNSN